MEIPAASRCRQEEGRHRHQGDSRRHRQEGRTAPAEALLDLQSAVQLQLPQAGVTAQPMIATPPHIIIRPITILLQMPILLHHRAVPPRQAIPPIVPIAERLQTAQISASIAEPG